MKKYLILLFIFTPFIVFAQPENSPAIVWQKCKNLYEAGKLDSTIVNISVSTSPLHPIDTIKQFYTYLDTFLFPDGYYAIGQLIIDPHMEFNLVQTGEWIYYYPSGKIYAKGNFSVGAYPECNAGGPVTMGYSFKTGDWIYWFENSSIMAQGNYESFKNNTKNNCGTVSVYVSTVTADKWRFFTSADNIEQKDIITNINNRH